MERIEAAKENILGGKKRVEVSREWAAKLNESYLEANGELLAAFKGLGKVLEHLDRADGIYRDQIKPRNAAIIVELIDASGLFFRAEDEGFWRSNSQDNPTHTTDGLYQDFSASEHHLQESHTDLLNTIAALTQARDTIQQNMSRQTDAGITGTPAEQTKNFAETIAPKIETTAQEWHDSM